MPLCLPLLTLDELVNLTLDPQLVEMRLVGCYDGTACAVPDMFSAGCQTVQDHKPDYGSVTDTHTVSAVQAFMPTKGELS